MVRIITFFLTYELKTKPEIDLLFSRLFFMFSPTRSWLYGYKVYILDLSFNQPKCLSLSLTYKLAHFAHVLCMKIIFHEWSEILLCLDHYSLQTIESSLRENAECVKSFLASLVCLIILCCAVFYILGKKILVWPKDKYCRIL